MIDTTGEDPYPYLKEHPVFLNSIRSVELYASKILPFIPRGLPVYQSHGICHSRSIIIRMNQFLKGWGIPVSVQEAYLLYLAAWLHDIGYLHPGTISKREDHGERSCDMIRSIGYLQDLVPQTNQITALQAIIRAHGSESDLSGIEVTSPVGRIQLLAAIFRLIDSLDLGTDRCPREIYEFIRDSLDNRARTHWIAHANISGIVFSRPVIRIMVHSLEETCFMGTIIPHLNHDAESVRAVFERYRVEPVILEYSESGSGVEPCPGE